ncbi:MAG TPA: hypothetical protein VKZ53_12630 [Candidatus Angelobacter sp.]|nr:hypothetical protein [Candidatus Angelobacter sp.]
MAGRLGSGDPLAISDSIPYRQGSGALDPNDGDKTAYPIIQALDDPIMSPSDH